MTDLDPTPTETSCPATSVRPGPVLERYEPREVPLGGIRAAKVQRTLPHRELPTVGAWCFLDAFTPGDPPMNILPHPHIGLQTVTWPLAGQMLHRDSSGHRQILQAGELNLMTSGDGIAHSEFMVDDAGAAGLQLWVALPAAARRVPAAFEHLADLPVLELPGARLTVFIGEHDGARSAATTHSPLLGLQLDLTADSAVDLPLRTDFEHAVLVTSGTIDVAGVQLSPGPLLYLGTDRESVTVHAAGAAQLVLLGGEPLGEDLLMWWNFVGRTHEDIVAARADWEDPVRRAQRFGTVPTHGDDHIPAPPLPATRLTPRRRRG